MRRVEDKCAAGANGQARPLLNRDGVRCVHRPAVDRRAAGIGASAAEDQLPVAAEAQHQSQPTIADDAGEIKVPPSFTLTASFPASVIGAEIVSQAVEDRNRGPGRCAQAQCTPSFPVASV